MTDHTPQAQAANQANQANPANPANLADPAALAAETPAPDAAPQRFETLALDAKLLRAVTESGYTAMTPIQA